MSRKKETKIKTVLWVIMCFFLVVFKKIRQFYERLATPFGLPTEMTLGGVTYEILTLLQGEENGIDGETMVRRAKEIGAHQGKVEREHVLKHQHQIPVCFRGKVVFLFTDDLSSEDQRCFHYVYWAQRCWFGHWRLLEDGFYRSSRVLRRKAVKKI